MVKSCVEFLLKHIIKRNIGGGIVVNRRRGRRNKKLLDDFEEAREYWAKGTTKENIERRVTRGDKKERSNMERGAEDSKG